MPGLVVFGRRWEIASDDLLFPGGLEIFIRAIWLLAISIVYNEHRDVLKCADGNLLAAYLIGVIVQLCLIIVVNAWIVHVSMQGTITNYRPRKQMPSLLYVRFALYIPELAWDIIGTYWTFRDHVGCDRDVVAIVEGAVIFSWIVLVLTAVGIAVIFDPLGSRNRFSYWPEERPGLESGETDQLITSARSAAARVWENRPSCNWCNGQVGSVLALHLNTVRILIEVCTPDLGLVGDKYSFMSETYARPNTKCAEHFFNTARPIDPWRATIIQAENWAEYLGVELAEQSGPVGVHLAGIFTWYWLIGAGWLGNDPVGMTKRLHQPSPGKYRTVPKIIYRCAARTMLPPPHTKGFDERSQNAFSDVAQVISDFFQDVDLTPSDIAAGLALLQQEQDRHSITRDPMSIVTTQPTPHGDPRLEDLGLVAHYMKFAMAAYGWPLYVYSNPLTSLCQLSTECSCCSCTSGQVEGGALIMSDNCCRCNLAGILQHTGLMATDVVYATFHNKGIVGRAITRLCGDKLSSHYIVPYKSGSQACRRSGSVCSRWVRQAVVGVVAQLEQQSGRWIHCQAIQEDELHRLWRDHVGIRPRYAGRGTSKQLLKLRYHVYNRLPHPPAANRPQSSTCCNNKASLPANYFCHVLSTEHNIMPRVQELKLQSDNDHQLEPRAFGDRWSLKRWEEPPPPQNPGYGHAQAQLDLELDLLKSAKSELLCSESFEFSDALTDLSAESETIDIEGVDGTFAHKGILQAASFIHKKLEEENILANAFWKVPDYSLVVVGHSLGAGAASLLSILLRPAYPRLFCYAYSPPGGLMSKSTAEYTKNFTCSVVLGKDLVPRLGISTMEDLKSKLITAINSSDQPKYKILVGGVWYTLCGSADQATPSSTTASSPNLSQPLLDEITSMPPGAAYTSQPDDSSLRRQGGATQSQVAPLYPPGHIIHIVEVEPASSCLSQPTYGAVWVDNGHFSNIIVNPKMLSDHMPDAVMKALDQLVQVQARGLQPFLQRRSQPVV
ncbi:hypothetical protein Bbelb_160940 [Branchiostoma belcheri]|nr:hypothetical protein Bbelb_160940 [Branchiostoma belcheri]